MKKEPIRVLQVLPCLQAAGVESYVMNLYRNIDRNNVQFDFLVHSKKRMFFDKEAEKMGGKIYRLTYKDDKNFIKYVRDLFVFFKTHPEYKIVHGEMQSMMTIYLWVAKICKVPVRIAHAHNADYEKTVKGSFLHLLSRFAKKFSTHNFACSELAGQYLFGRSHFIVMPNAIDTNKFQFSKHARRKIRGLLGVKGDTVIVGNVGRFEPQKNHKFMIDVFYELQKRVDARLLLIGTGSLQRQLQNMIDKLGITDKVIFAGAQRNVADYFSAMDVFFMPSLYEGLPVAGVEAQCSGLRCVMSDNVTSEVNIINAVVFLGLNSSISDWCKAILNSLVDANARLCAAKKIEGSNYDIRVNVDSIEQFYYNVYKDSI